MTTKIAVRKDDVLVVVDIQNDFCPGGSLSVPRGHEVVPIINRLARRFQHVPAHSGLAPAGPSLLRIGPSREATTRYRNAFYGPQILWPDHCVRTTSGAEFHADLHIPHAALVLRKGIHREIDSYSTFYENDRTTPTGLVGYLRERGFGRVFLAGLAFDFCVRYSAEDAQREKFEVVVVEDACRGIDVDGSMDAARESFEALGIVRTTAEAVG